MFLFQNSSSFNCSTIICSNAKGIIYPIWTLGCEVLRKGMKKCNCHPSDNIYKVANWIVMFIPICNTTKFLKEQISWNKEIGGGSIFIDKLLSSLESSGLIPT